MKRIGWLFLFAVMLNLAPDARAQPAMNVHFSLHIMGGYVATYLLAREACKIDAELTDAFDFTRLDLEAQKFGIQLGQCMKNGSMGIARLLLTSVKTTSTRVRFRFRQLEKDEVWKSSPMRAGEHILEYSIDGNEWDIVGAYREMDEQLLQNLRDPSYPKEAEISILLLKFDESNSTARSTPPPLQLEAPPQEMESARSPSSQIGNLDVYFFKRS